MSITAGAGTDIATDDVGSVHFQQVKLVNGTLGSTTAAIVGSTGSLQVDQRPSKIMTQVDSAGLTIASTAYAANDVLGTGWEFTSYARASGGTGRIVGGTLVDVNDIVTVVDIYLFDRAVTFGTDNAIISTTGVSDADALFFMGKLTFGVDDLTGARVGSVDSISIPYRCNATSLFAYAVTRVLHTFFTAATDLKLRLVAELD